MFECFSNNPCEIFKKHPHKLFVNKRALCLERDYQAINGKF